MSASQPSQTDQQSALVAIVKSQPEKTKSDVVNEIAGLLEKFGYLTKISLDKIQITNSDYRIQLSFDNFVLEKDEYIDVYDAPLDFLYAIWLYSTFNLKGDEILNNSSSLNWSTRLKKLLSNFSIIENAKKHNYKKILFIDSTKLKTSDDVKTYIQSRISSNLRSVLVVVYNYKSGEWCDKYKSLKDEQTLAVSDVNTYHITTVNIINLLKLMTNFNFEAPTKIIKYCHSIELAKLDEFIFEVFDITKEQVSDFIELFTGQYVTFAKISTLIKWKVESEYHNMFSQHLEKIKNKSREFNENNKVENNKVVNNQVGNNKVGDNQDDKALQMEDKTVNVNSEDIKPTKDDLQKKYDLTKEQSDMLDLYLSIPQPNPDAFNLDKIVEQIKNKSINGWQLLLKLTSAQKV